MKDKEFESDDRFDAEEPSPRTGHRSPVPNNRREETLGSQRISPFHLFEWDQIDEEVQERIIDEVASQIINSGPLIDEALERYFEVEADQTEQDETLSQESAPTTPDDDWTRDKDYIKNETEIADAVGEKYDLQPGTIERLSSTVDRLVELQEISFQSKKQLQLYESFAVSFVGLGLIFASGGIWFLSAISLLPLFRIVAVLTLLILGIGLLGAGAIGVRKFD